MKKLLCVMVLATLCACGGSKADKIGEADTVFNLLGKNDRIEIEGFDDPDVSGVSCYLSYAKKGGLKETVNLEEDASDSSIACVQTAEKIEFSEKSVMKPRQIFKRSSNATFKSMQVMRYYDAKRKAFSYLVYSDRIIEGSPKNSLSAIACAGTPKLDTGAIADQPNKQLYGSCLIEVAVK